MGPETKQFIDKLRSLLRAVLGTERSKDCKEFQKIDFYWLRDCEQSSLFAYLNYL